MKNQVLVGKRASVAFAAFLVKYSLPSPMDVEISRLGLLADTLGPLIILAIAIPFALSGVRVSPAVGVSKSIGLFFAYYLLANFSTLLGGKGLLDPLWAAVMPNLTMIGVGTYLFGRMR